MTNYLRALFPSAFLDENDAAARAADLSRNDFSPQLASQNSTQSDCYVDPESGMIYIRDDADQAVQSLYGAHDVTLDDGSTAPTDSMRVILPPEMVNHLHADPAFDAAYHQLSGTTHHPGEQLPPPGAQADYHPETQALLGSGSFDFASPMGSADNIAEHRIVDVGPYNQFDSHYPAPDRLPGPDHSDIGRDDWQSNFGPCDGGEYRGEDSPNIDTSPPHPIPTADFLEHAFDRASEADTHDACPDPWPGGDVWSGGVDHFDDLQGGYDGGGSDGGGSDGGSAAGGE